MVQRQKNARSDKLLVGVSVQNDSLELESLVFSPKCANPDSDKKKSATAPRDPPLAGHLSPVRFQNRLAPVSAPLRPTPPALPQRDPVEADP